MLSEKLDSLEGDSPYVDSCPNSQNNPPARMINMRSGEPPMSSPTMMMWVNWIVRRRSSTDDESGLFQRFVRASMLYRACSGGPIFSPTCLGCLGEIGRRQRH